MAESAGTAQIVIGLDPGANTGVAYYVGGKLHSLQTRNSSIGTHNVQGKPEIFSNDLFFSYQRGFILLTDCI